MLPKLTFIDIETTGYSPKNDKILEISAIVTENLEVKEVINTIINPRTYLSGWIKNFTNISDADIVDAPDFAEIAPHILNSLEDSIFVAHNADFDYGFVKKAFDELKINFETPRLCSVKLFRNLYKSKKASLDTVIDYFGFDCQNRHRAYDDAKIILDMFNAIKDDYGEDRLLETIEVLIQRPIDPKNKLSKDLPNKCGVYIFYDKENSPLYVGKSKDIKSRVNTHILDSYKTSKKASLINSAEYVDYIETKGEFGALLKEAELIKEINPVFNRSLRRRKGLTFLKVEKNEEGYYCASFERTQNLHPEDLNQTSGIFLNNTDAKNFLEKIYDEHLLCTKLLGLEKYDGKPCFRTQLNKCLGACCNKEDAFDYNKRFLKAFEKVLYEKWPFDSPICVIEKDPDTYESEIHLIDKWCHLGTYNEVQLSDQMLHLKDTSINELIFDLDIYRLIKSWLKNYRKRDMLVIPFNELKAVNNI